MVEKTMDDDLRQEYDLRSLRVRKVGPRRKNFKGQMETVPAIHPGKHLAGELREFGMSAASLARQIEVPASRITEILNGRHAITGDTALRLAHFFDSSAEFWLNLQKLYELRIAEDEIGEAIRALPTLKDREAVQTGRMARKSEPEPIEGRAASE